MALPNLKRLRGAMTLEQLSEQTGISVSQISRYERGGVDGRDPTLAHLRAFAGVFKVSIDEIVEPSLRSTVSVAELNASSDGTRLYKNQLRDSDCIQAEIGVLRNLIIEALVDQDVSNDLADAYADGVISCLIARQADTVVVRLAASVRTDPGLQALEPDDPTPA